MDPEYLQKQYAENRAYDDCAKQQTVGLGGAALGGNLRDPFTTQEPRPKIWDDPRGWAHDITRHHAPDRKGLEGIAAIRAATENLINEILQSCPDSGDRVAALGNARVAMMFANAAIALDGRA